VVSTASIRLQQWARRSRNALTVPFVCRNALEVYGWLWRITLGWPRPETGVVRLRSGESVEIRLHNALDIGSILEVFTGDVYTPDAGPLPKNGIVFDVGSSIGDFIVSLRGLAVKRVLAVEPDATVIPILERNVSRNGMASVTTVVRAAVGGPMNGVRGVTLDQLFEEYAVDRCDLLKVDCEGGEYEMFRTASSSALARIRNIVMECHPVSPAEFEAFETRLAAEGFTVRSTPWNCHGIRYLYASRSASPSVQVREAS
jgi:predicted RNA methylase